MKKDIVIRAEFDDMRPYRDEEIPAAMERIAAHDMFPILARFLYPERTADDVAAELRGFKNVWDFQHVSMKRFNERIVEQTISGLSLSGTERLNAQGAYLYVSNHRDIVLDSSLLEYAIDKKGFGTTEITFGANLMMNDLIVDIGKSNKMFKVERPGGSAKEFYAASKHLSDYLRYTIAEKGESVWIAQRNGRTKDGWDKTDSGIIKMFAMSNRRDELSALTVLNIVPMAISYEWEPCDEAKAVELYRRSQLAGDAKYVKAPGEDLQSILTGILQPKGSVHIELCPPLTAQDLQQVAALEKVDLHKTVAALIDSRIHEGYRLMPSNYAAADMLARLDSKYDGENTGKNTGKNDGNSTGRYADKYTPEVMTELQRRVDALAKHTDCDQDALRRIFLDIYANPVKAKSVE